MHDPQTRVVRFYLRADLAERLNREARAHRRTSHDEAAMIVERHLQGLPPDADPSAEDERVAV